MSEDQKALLSSTPSGRRKRNPSIKKTVATKVDTSNKINAPAIQIIPQDYEFVSEIEKDREVIFKPNKGPQTDFLAASEREVLFGGSAGGGKSYAILADALRDLVHPQFRGLILRRTTEELRELVQKSQELYPKALPGIKWSERKMEWRSPAGGSLWMSFLERDQDVSRYQGQAFNYIAFDELTQWPTPYAWNYMRSRLRSTAPDLKLYMRATTNPGGQGHNWVKKMFIDPAQWNTAFWATDIESGETLRWPKGHTKEGEPLFKRRFIPSRLSDNPYLYNSGDYEANLLSLPEADRKRLLDGDWDIVEGSAFPEWDRSIHVIEPYDIPNTWRRFRACDFGYSSFSAVVWFAVTPEEQLVIYRELYVSKMLATDLAGTILDLEAEDGPITYGVLDSSCWHQRGQSGPSIAETMIAAGCRWRPSDRSRGARVAGKNELHRRLQVDEYTNEPRLVVFSNCINTVAQLPVIQLDKNNIEDVNTHGEDHIYDAIRYGVMSRPRSSAWDVNPETTRHYRPADLVFGY